MSWFPAGWLDHIISSHASGISRLREIVADRKSGNRNELEISRVSQRAKLRETQLGHVNAWTFCGLISWYRRIDDTMDWLCSMWAVVLLHVFCCRWHSMHFHHVPILLRLVHQCYHYKTISSLLIMFYSLNQHFQHSISLLSVVQI